MIIIIPSRYDSVRLPGKPLADINGKTLIEHVYHCAQSSDATKIVVATDDERILSTVKKFGGEVILTSKEHQSGTDRLNEAIKALGIDDDEVVINLQGDEPLMPSAIINDIADIFKKSPEVKMATACFEIVNENEFTNPNLVKVVFDKKNQALYFSRAPIPWPANKSTNNKVLGYGHIGIYGYRAGFVKQFSKWSVCDLEKSEKLEQLRALHNGASIKVVLANEMPAPGVDTPEDLELARKLLA